MKKLFTVLSLLIFAGSTHAQIIFDSINAPQGSYQTNVTVASGYTPTAGTNAVLLMGVALDGSLSSPSATFGGNAMTLLASDTRVAIFGYVLPNANPGDLVLSTGLSNAETIVTYGTLKGVDATSFAGRTTATDASAVDGTAKTITGSSLNSLSSGSYVFSVFSQNSMFDATGISQSPLSSLQNFSGTAGGSYTGSIAGGLTASAGNFTPVLSVTDASNFPGNTNSSYFAAVAFVPEPSSAALLGLAGLALVAARRRRHS